MDLEDLPTFVDVADAGGVSSAARRLEVSKSIVSRRLFRLEAELGVQLLARTTRGAALTEAGVTFREHAARVCAEIDIALETIMPAGELRGRLRIAAPLSLGPTHLAPVFAEMARRHPLLHVHASYSDPFVDIVGEGFDWARHRLASRSHHQGLSGFRRPCSGHDALCCSDGRPVRRPASWSALHTESPSSHRTAD
jgi:DNA-binding transcriptional LysR family regulator